MGFGRTRNRQIDGKLLLKTTLCKTTLTITQRKLFLKTNAELTLGIFFFEAFKLYIDACYFVEYPVNFYAKIL